MRTHQPSAARRRRGLSIVEVLVALILVSVGLLAMAGSTALALRTTLDAQRRRAAVHRIDTRFAQLAAAGCDHASSGADSDVTRRISERWTVGAPATAFTTVTDSVSWMTAQGTRSLAITSAITC